MSHYHCVPLALSPSGDHLSNPVKCSSELSCQETGQLGYLSTDAFLSLFENCPWHFKAALSVNGKVPGVRSCQLQVNSVVSLGMWNRKSTASFIVINVNFDFLIYK